MRACWVFAAFVLAVCAPAQDKGIEVDGVDLREAVRAIAKGGALDVLVVDAARGKVTATVDPSDPEAALRAIASAAGVGLAKDEFGVLWVGGAPAEAKPEPKEREALDDLMGLDVRTAIRKICAREGVALAIGPGVEGKVTAKVDASDWRAALRRLAPPGVVVGERHAMVFVVRPRQERRADRPLVFDDVPVTTVLESLATDAGVKIVIDEGVAGRVTLRTTRVPWRHALQIIAESVGARVSRGPDGTYRVRPGEKRHAFGGEHLAVSTPDDRGLPVAKIAQILSAILEQEVRLHPEVMAAGASVVIDGVHSSKQQFADLLCNCCQLDMVELASGAVELRFRTDG